MATAYADVASAVQALKLGAFDYLSKPLQLPELVVTVRKALEAKRLRAQVRQLTGRAQAAMGDFVPGASAAMRKVIDMVDKVAEATDTTVLIQGESGTGKELIANLIAPPDAAAASDEPFIEINCASVPENLLESELFGYERGAFTDAKAQKRGLFEAADGGTLLLDEVGEMPPAHPGQAAEGAGGDDLPAPGRHARSDGQRAGHRRDQQGAGRRGRARGVPARPLPPARRVPHARAAAARAARGHPAARRRTSWACSRRACASRRARFAPETERILLAYDYPGNVRELRNLIERAVILSSGEAIEPELHRPLRPDARAARPAAAFFAVDLDEAGQPPDLDALEPPTSRGCWRSRGGNRTAVARLLGVSYPTMAKKIADYGLA